jgi:hypothetical protein
MVTELNGVNSDDLGVRLLIIWAWETFGEACDWAVRHSCN